MHPPSVHTLLFLSKVLRYARICSFFCMSCLIIGSKLFLTMLIHLELLKDYTETRRSCQQTRSRLPSFKTSWHSLTTLRNPMPNLCQVECPISKTAGFYSYQLICPRQESTVSTKPSVTIFMRHLLAEQSFIKFEKKQGPLLSP